LSEQEQVDSSSHEDFLPWWVRLCRWIWKIIVFLGITVILDLIINVGSTWLTNPDGRIPADSPLGLLLANWPLMLPVGGCFILVALVTWRVSRWKSHRSVRLSLTQRDRVRVLRRLRLSYRDILSHSLQGVAWIDLGLAEKPDAVWSATMLLLRLSSRSEIPLPPGTSILDAYDQVEHELLILGGPGTGKSTLLLNLALQLLVRAEQQEDHPLPVILPLSSWAEKRPLLEIWIAEQLTQIYHVPRQLSERWVREDRILPLLDGLDEMNEYARSAGIAAINAYHQTHLVVPLVVCSRLTEYAVAAERQLLTLQSAVVVQPLTKEQIDASLREAGGSLSALRSALKKNTALLDLATSPLMLNVLMLAYRGTSLRELPSKKTQLQQQVWSDYIARMVEHKGNRARYPLQQTCAWLAFLAKQMRKRNQTILYLEHLQPEWLPSGRLSRFYELLAVKGSGILVGVVASLLMSIGYSIGDNLADTLWYGFLGGAMGGLLSGNFFTDFRLLSLIRAYVRNWKNLCLFGLSYGLFVGIITAMVLLVAGRMRDAFIYGIGVGLCIFLLSFVIHAGKISTLSGQPTRLQAQGWLPAWFIEKVQPDHLRLALFTFLICSLSFGVSFGMSFVADTNVSEGVNNALSSGLRNGVTYGVSLGFLSVVLCFFLAGKSRIEPAEIITWSVRHLGYNLLRMDHLRTSLQILLYASCCFGLGYGISAWLSYGPGAGLRFGLGAGVGIGLSIGVMYWVFMGFWYSLSPQMLDDERRIKPNQGITWSVRNGLFIGIVVGCLCIGVGFPVYIAYFTLTEGVRKGLSDGLDYGVSHGIGVGIVAALLATLLMGGLAGLRHLFLRLLLAYARLLPWQTVDFLDDATRRILLYKDGGGYRFIHRLFLDYCADLDASSDMLPAQANEE
jgi:hypothetical protein